MIGSDLQLSFEKNPPRDLRRTLGERIDEFNARTVPFEQEQFALVLRDADDSLVGGLYAVLYWGWLFVDELWIDDDWRGNGLGSELLRRAEMWAREHGCHSVWLDTFQAHGFYEKLGYEVFGTLDDYPAGQRRSFLKKRIAP